ncbi:MAG: DEAD/DEAH box helicase family protein [Desulfotalea sp.]
MAISDKSCEYKFQADIIKELQAGGWLLGSPENYDRKRALYATDLLGFVQETQDAQWQKYSKLFPNDPESKFLDRVVAQQEKADTNASGPQMRSFGTLGVLRHEIKERGTRFSLCQFKPENDLNPITMGKYRANRFRVVPELVYSPWATEQEMAETGVKAKAWRLDLAFFVNGLPIATMELKSEFKQDVQNAIKQYKKTRPPVDPGTKKKEPLLTFKRGALVHFAVSQYDAFMTTKLMGAETFFLPFNRGTKDGGKGNDTPKDKNKYATAYLWQDVFAPDNLLNILGRYIHLQIEDKEDASGLKTKKETMIFPRYHQWDVVEKLIGSAKEEGPGQKYLIQHSAGSGKSNSIAWTAHQLSALTKDDGTKVFQSTIVVTDRTVLDDQLQDTIYQFEHKDGVVGRISRDVGGGSKSEQLAHALTTAQPIIIVTIQTFPFVLKAIEADVNLKERCYAIIADEAHSSQTGSTARKLKEVLMIEERDEDENLSSDDVLDATMASRRANTNLSYFAFTATPKTKTLELFGQLPKPDEAPSKTNKPVAFHVYTMRQAIEEGFILDVLQNYTNYRVAYNLALQMEEKDKEVESKRAKVKLNQWVRLHDYNIAQKVQVIIEHFKDNVMGLLQGQAKAMVVTSSRKEAVRYKLCFEKYISQQGYQNIHALVAFSGEVEFFENDPNAEALLGEKFTETGSNMNPGLKGRDMRRAFDGEDYQVMIVANKFQTGFDQPKLCAMYVDKKLGGVECVQTLSRLNRTYLAKAETGTFILDFFNDPEDILAAFQPYYQTAELTDVSDPDLIYDLSEKLRASGIFLWNEVEIFCESFLINSKSSAAIANICKPAVERWTNRYKDAIKDYNHTKMIFEQTKDTGNAILLANAEKNLKDAKKEKDALEIFKKDLGSFVRFYEFMSQIVDYDDKDLEKLSLYARSLRPMLRETLVEEDEIDLNYVELSHYRLSKIRQQELQLEENNPDYKLTPGEGLGSATARDKEEAYLSLIIEKLNELFETDKLSEGDMVNYLHTIKDKVLESDTVVQQVRNNNAEQAKLGDFAHVLLNAIMESSDAHQNQMFQLMSNEKKMKSFGDLIFGLVEKEAVAEAQV